MQFILLFLHFYYLFILNLYLQKKRGQHGIIIDWQKVKK